VERSEEDQWVRPDGSTAWGKWEVRPWLTATGEVGGVVIFAEDITARKAAEDALRASEQRLRLFIATAPAAIAMFDRRLCYVAASQVWLKEHSLSGDVAGVCHYDAFPNMPQEWKDLHQRTLAGAVQRREEERWVRPDGSVAWCRWEMRPWLGANGEVGGLVIFIEDITASRAAEGALRETQERETTRRVEMEALMAAAPVIVWIAHDAECRVITGNPAGEAILRAPAGRNLSKTAPEAERPRHFQVFQDGKPVPDHELCMQVAGRTGKPVTGVEQEIRFADGTARWIYGNAVPLLKPDGAVRGVVATFVDITERKRIEEALRETEAQLRLVTDTTAAALVRCSRDQRYLFANRAYAEMLGLEPEDIVGKAIPEVLGVTGYAAIQPHIETVLKGRPVEFEVEMPYPVAGVRRLRVFYVPQRNETGDVMGWVASMSDISDWKRAEAELQASREQLRTLAARLQEVREEERARLAREIHDVLAQELTRIKMDIAWLNRRLAQPVDAAQQPLLLEKLAAMTELADTAIGSVQRIATELRPFVLDSFGLCAAIEWQVKDFGVRSGIRCAAHVPARDFPLGRERSTALFRILQESLTNVARHAAATYLDVDLFGDAETVTLKVRDNGRGIETGQLNNPRAMGLLGMRERAALLGGNCQISRDAAGGTLVEARLPLPPGAGDKE
jgi:PAS domain S-box-containing protein